MLPKELTNEGIKLDPLGGQNLHKELESAAKVCILHNLFSKFPLI